VTFSFLIASPVINEVAIVMLLGLVGWKITALYIGVGFIIAVAVGFILGLLHLEDQIEEFVLTSKISKAAENSSKEMLTLGKRVSLAFEESKEIIKQVWLSPRNPRRNTCGFIHHNRVFVQLSSPINLFACANCK